MTSCLSSFESDVAAREQSSVWWVGKRAEKTYAIFGMGLERRTEHMYLFQTAFGKPQEECNIESKSPSRREDNFTPLSLSL